MKLEDIKKENPFTVPDGYFENFYNRLQSKLIDEPKIEKSRILYLKPLFAVAASIIFILLLSKPISISENTINTVNTVQTELADDDLIEYIASTNSDYDIFMELNN